MQLKIFFLFIIVMFQMDANGNISQSTDRAGRVTTMRYDKAGRIQATIDAKGHRTEYEYDAAGRRILSRDALGNESKTEYDPNGQRTAIIDAKQQRTDYRYDANGQSIRTDYADNSNSQTQYDALGRRSAQIDQAGRKSQYEYDPMGNLTAVIDPLQQRTEYTYDLYGNKTRQTDANQHSTTWTYDPLGRVSSRQLPLLQTETFSYDILGNIASKTDFNGNSTQYHYDNSNHRLTQIDYADGQSDAIQYDIIGNRIQLSQRQANQADIITQWRYDSRDRLIQETQANGNTLNYLYDASGNRSQFALKAANDTVLLSIVNTYDALNRLKTVTDSSNSSNNSNNTGSGRTEYDYDALGNRIRIIYPNQSQQDYQYNTVNQLTQLRHYDANNNLIQQYDYQLDATGRRTQIDELTGRSSQYRYDTLNRLIEENITDPNNGDYQALYQYDNTGNRTYSTIDCVQTAYTYDDNDRLVQQGGMVYQYDANGNTLEQRLDLDTTTYNYDARNHLVASIETSGSTELRNSSYHYNADGIRDSKTENGQFIEYNIDSNRDYAQVIAETVDGSLNKTYTYGDDLISQRQIASDQSHYYHYDGLGSTRLLSDDNGEPSDYYDYEAFGGVLNQTGVTDNDYLFTGEQFDSGLGLYSLRARYYSPRNGRFTQQDTYMGNNSDPTTLHKYLYANADPVNGIDPTGHMTLPQAMAGIGMFGALLTTALPNYFNQMVSVGEGLIGGGFASGINADLKDFIKRNAPSISVALEEKRIRTKAKV